MPETDETLGKEIMKFSVQRIVVVVKAGIPDVSFTVVIFNLLSFLFLLTLL